MVFANLLFIYLFLPLNLILYFLSKRIVYRNLVLVDVYKRQGQDNGRGGRRVLCISVGRTVSYDGAH